MPTVMHKAIAANLAFLCLDISVFLPSYDESYNFKKLSKNKNRLKFIRYHAPHISKFVFNLYLYYHLSGVLFLIWHERDVFFHKLQISILPGICNENNFLEIAGISAWPKESPDQRSFPHDQI